VQNPDGSEKAADAWREANIVGVPEEVVGRLVYGTLAEETNPVSNVAYQKAGSHVLIAKYSKTDPLEEFTTAQALCLPIIDNADGIYVLHADAADAAEDETHAAEDAQLELEPAAEETTTTAKKTSKS
jgi:N-acetyl-beta-hexosaminidase